MIIDFLKNYSSYLAVNQSFNEAFSFIFKNLSKFPKTGDYEINGRIVYSLVRDIETKHFKEGIWEAHKEYIDIHYIFEGEELFGYSNISKMNINEYVKEKDKFVLSGEGDLIRISTGSFVIFFPQDAHIPGIRSNNFEKVKKIIVKVKFNL